MIDFDKKPNGVIGAIAVLPGGVFKSRINVADFLFEAFVEIEESSGVLLVDNGEPDRACIKALLQHDVAGEKANFLCLKLRD